MTSKINLEELIIMFNKVKNWLSPTPDDAEPHDAFKQLNEIALLKSTLTTDLRHLTNIGIKHGWTIGRPRTELADFLSAADFIEIESAALV